MNKIENNKNNNNTDNFSLNYQKAYNNYNNAINYYVNNLKIITCIIDIIYSYKESIITFKKKLIQIKSNIIKPFYDEEQNKYKYEGKIYSFYNKILFNLNQIINFKIDSNINILNEIETKIFFNKENFENYINALQENKNVLQNNQKKMEKIFSEYNIEYKKLMDKFYFIEEYIKNFSINKKLKNEKYLGIKELNNQFNEGINLQNLFLKIHYQFKENNKAFFDFYYDKMKEIENEIIKNEHNIESNINLFFLTLINNSNSIMRKLMNFLYANKEKKDNSIMKSNNNNEINNNKDIEKNISYNFNLFCEEQISKLETKYEKEKYKIKAINLNKIKDEMSLENKKMLNDLSKQFGIKESIFDLNTILSSEEIYEIIKYFYSSFDFVDKTKYDLILEKNKLEIKKLTNKLLQPGLIKTNFEEYKGLLPINDEEIKKLKNYLSKYKEYRKSFLQIINNYRTFGKYEMPEREFELIGNYFVQIIDYILKEKSEEDFNSVETIVVLSQTFYINKNGKKYYLINKLKGHKLFLETEFFTKYLKSCIKKDIEDSKLPSNKKLLTTSEIEDIIIANILPFYRNMKDLNVPEKQVKIIIDIIYKEYDIKNDIENSFNFNIFLDY